MIGLDYENVIRPSSGLVTLSNNKINIKQVLVIMNSQVQPELTSRARSRIVIVTWSQNE